MRGQESEAGQLAGSSDPRLGRPADCCVLRGRSQGKGQLGELWGRPPPISNDRTLRVISRGERAVSKKGAPTHTNTRAMRE